MSERWLIIADDLTGAADSAIAFAGKGAHTLLIWDGGDITSEERPSILAYNTASRERLPVDSQHAHRLALDRWLEADTRLYKKIDSTLRGQPAAEIDAVRRYMRSRGSSGFGILAPAFPALGRTTQGGHVHVDGQPLEHTEVWARDRSYPNANLVEILSSEGIQSSQVPIFVIRSGADELNAELEKIAESGAMAVCDALLQDDLLSVAVAARKLDAGCFFVGSGGLAHALAETSDITPSNRPSVRSPSRGGSLIVVGSVASASRSASQELSKSSQVRHMLLPRELLLGDVSRCECLAFAREIMQTLSMGDDVLVEIVFSGRPGAAIVPELAKGLARMLAPCAMHAGGIAATGGETAAALLIGMQAHGVRLLEEIEPGICLGVTLGRYCIPVITKAGAFGDSNSLVRMAQRLRDMRQLGLNA